MTENAMPLKPLPEGLEDGAKCSYCGVSYLVMHEIEEYKDAIAELQKKVKLFEIRESSQEFEEQNSCQSIEELAIINEQLNVQVKSQAEQNGEYRAEISKLEKQVFELQKTLKDVQCNITAYSQMVRDKLESIKKVSFVFAADGEIIKEIQLFEQLKREQVAELRIALEATVEELSAAENHIQTLSEEVRTTKVEMNELTDELEQSEAKTSELLAESIKNAQRFDFLSEELNNTKIVSKQLVSENDELKSMVASMKATTQSLQNENNSSTTKYLSALKEIERLQMLNEELEARISNAEKARNDEIFVQTEQFKEELAEQQGIIEDLTSKLNASREEVEQLRDELTQHEQNARTYIAELQKQKNTNERLEEQLDVVNVKIAGSQTRLEAHKHCFMELLAELNKLKTLIAAEQKTWDSAFNISDFNRHIQRLAKFSCGKETLAAQLDESKLYIAELETELALENAEVDRLRSQTTKTDAQEDYSQYIQQTNEANARADALAEENEALKAKVTNLQQTVFHECKERNDLMRTLNQLRTQMAQSAEKPAPRPIK